MQPSLALDLPERISVPTRCIRTRRPGAGWSLGLRPGRPGRAAGRALRLPRPGAVSRSLRGSTQPGHRHSQRRRRHVFRGQRERPAAPGGAAQAGGRRGEDQGLAGGRGASAVLHAECLQGRTAGWCSGRKQPLQGAQILCFTLKTAGKKFIEECVQAQSDGWLPPSPKNTVAPAK